jgi:hypothetical protein
MSVKFADSLGFIGSGGPEGARSLLSTIVGSIIQSRWSCLLHNHCCPDPGQLSVWATPSPQLCSKHRESDHSRNLYRDFSLLHSGPTHCSWPKRWKFHTFYLDHVRCGSGDCEPWRIDLFCSSRFYFHPGGKSDCESRPGIVCCSGGTFP